jgi:hypothetical protein
MVRILDKPLLFALLCLGLIVLGGCSPEVSPLPNVLTRSLSGIKRVVFIGLDERNSLPGVAKDMTTALSHAVKARGLFGLDVVDRQDPVCEDVFEVGRGGFTLVQIKELRQTFKCDAILLGSIDDFRPHPRMQLGVSLRMLDLKRGRILWAVDHVWDTTDKAVENRIKRYFRDHIRSGYEPMDWRIAMISPKAFEKFIAYELAETLPDPVHASVTRKGEKRIPSKPQK